MHFLPLRWLSSKYRSLNELTLDILSSFLLCIDQLLVELSILYRVGDSKDDIHLRVAANVFCSRTNDDSSYTLGIIRESVFTQTLISSLFKHLRAQKTKV